ncbi:MAG: class I SAM-dependent methyltransferase [Candidatus Bathyarchaeota archaeon]
MLILSGLKSGEILYDLGSGDGRAVIMAAKDFGAKSFGIELRDDLTKKAFTSIHELGLEEKTKIFNNDIFDVDLSSADVVFLYLTTSANERIKPKLELCMFMMCNFSFSFLHFFVLQKKMFKLCVFTYLPSLFSY